MVLWGAGWGLVLSLLWPGSGGEWRMLLGGLLGALAGHTLRGAVRAEVARAAGQQAVPAPRAPRTPEPTPAPWPDAPPDFADTTPVVLRPSSRSAAPPVPAATPAAPLLGTLIARARDWLLGGNTIVRLGLVVLFVGLAFLAKYAADNALLPPQVRLAAVGAAGIGLFTAGWRLRGRTDRRGAALSLQGAGIAVLYLAVFAAFRLYQLLPAGAAFVGLGLACAFAAVIAVVQNAQAVAVIGVLGGFTAPILASTGQGSHVGLFGVYLVLGLAIVAMGWARPWRALHMVGFVATFVVGTAWGVLRYAPAHFASTEPFLVAFVLLYIAAAVLHALRHGLAPQRAVDGTLVFGVPLVGFGLQAALVRELSLGSALSALALGALYLGLTAWLAGRARRGDTAARWLAECFVALGLGFVTLAVPLALEARWTSAVWAVEGAAVFWLGRRQGRWLPCVTGLALQLLAALAWLDGLDSARQAAAPLAGWLGAVMLAGAALLLAWWSRTPPTGRTGLDARVHQLAAGLSPLLLCAGFLWWFTGLRLEIERLPLNAPGLDVTGPALRLHLSLLAWVASAAALQWLASPRRADPWPQAAWPAYSVLPALLLGALAGMATLPHVAFGGGWIAWPILLGLHLWLLRRLDGVGPRGWWTAVHAGGVWLLVLLAGNLLVTAVREAGLWDTAWADAMLLVAATAAVLGLAHPALHRGTASRWPLQGFARAYGWLAAAPLATGLALGALAVAVHSDGTARPLPYLPLLNPTDLAVALALAACTGWLLQLRRGTLAVPAGVHGPAPLLVLAGLAFIAFNTVWLRVAHQLAGVPWSADTLAGSFLVQAGYSILWTVLALCVMVLAVRRGARPAWMVGAGLLGVTVAKLFLVDLANRGGAERIVVFIAVGLLMLVLGWLAPLPPARPRAQEGTA